MSDAAPPLDVGPWNLPPAEGGGEREAGHDPLWRWEALGALLWLPLPTTEPL